MGPKSKFGTKKVPRYPSSIPGGDPKRFQDSSNYVFHIVGECFSRAARTHLATDLTCKLNFRTSKSNERSYVKVSDQSNIAMF